MFSKGDIYLLDPQAMRYDGEPVNAHNATTVEIVNGYPDIDGEVYVKALDTRWSGYVCPDDLEPYDFVEARTDELNLPAVLDLPLGYVLDILDLFNAGLEIVYPE